MEIESVISQLILLFLLLYVLLTVWPCSKMFINTSLSWWLAGYDCQMYLGGYVNVSQLGQPDLNPGNCSENNIKWMFKKIPKYGIQSHTVFFLFFFWHFWTIVLYYPVFKMALYSSSMLCVWVGDFLSFIHLKQKNDNLKFLWIKQMDFYNSYKKW